MNDLRVEILTLILRGLITEGSREKIQAFVCTPFWRATHQRRIFPPRMSR